MKRLTRETGRTSANAMRLRTALLLLVTLSACSTSRPFVTTIGALPPGTTMHIRAVSAQIDVYKPKIGEPSNRYTISATAFSGQKQPPPPMLLPTRDGISVAANDPLRFLLVRAPAAVNVDVRSQRGNVSVTDISGNATAYAGNGDVHIMLSGYAQASTGNGNITVYMGAGHWPGTLHFSTDHGDVLIYVKATAHFTAQLHTDDGTIFTDFRLHGSARGTAETLAGAVAGGGKQAIDIHVKRGAIRLLRLLPQS